MLISAKNLKTDSCYDQYSWQDQGVKTKLQNVYFCFVGSRSEELQVYCSTTTPTLWFLDCLSAEWSTLIGRDFLDTVI